MEGRAAPLMSTLPAWPVRYVVATMLPEEGDAAF